MLKRIIIGLLILNVTVGALPQARAAQGPVSFIRDAEIEHSIRLLATPLFEAAGLTAESVRVYLIRDQSLNAFVAGGQRLFLNTGLLLRVETPNQLSAVIAHETGHIAGGHLARTQAALESASAQTILSYLLGTIAIVGGAGQAGSAIIAGGQQTAERSFLKYSRTQESAADQAALSYLERTGQSGEGLVEVLDMLGDQEALLSINQDPYARSHPISRERISVVGNRVNKSPFADNPDTSDFIMRHQRMQAKLTGYLEPPQKTLNQYPPTDQSVPAKYARSVAYHMLGDRDHALAELDGLLASSPDDPFFLELKGQILMEHGRIEEAIAPLERAVKLAPGEPLLRALLGKALVALEKPDENRRAIAHLTEALRQETGLAATWHQLAIALGRDGQMGRSALASAEEAFIRGRLTDAKSYAERARHKLEKGTPSHLRALDLLAIIDKRLTDK